MSIRIAADIMGGDRPETELASGAIAAAGEFGVEVTLVGSAEARSLLGELPENVSFREAGSTVLMTDDPSAAMKEKSDSSLTLAVAMCRDGEADAAVSAGNTGALFTAASLMIRRIKGVRRAALCSVIPLEKPFLLLDCGANLDATPEILQLYGFMGSVYAGRVLGIENARVGLLNNGIEPQKGTPLYQKAYALMKADTRINFVGNIEGKEVPFGKCDVLVCDGFTGNITLKLIEGMAGFMSKSIKGVFSGGAAQKLGGLLTLSKTRALKKRLDPKEYGGAPFLGLAGPVIKAHGSSDAFAFRSAIKQAISYCKSGTVAEITASLAKGNISSPEE